MVERVVDLPDTVESSNSPNIYAGTLHYKPTGTRLVTMSSTKQCGDVIARAICHDRYRFERARLWFGFFLGLC